MPQFELGKLHLRVARPTDNLESVVKFYRDGLGFTVLYEFTNHDGFDGVMLGHPGAGYHLEFTRKHGHRAGKAPTEDNLLVFYVPDEADWKRAVTRMEGQGHRPVKSFNPYWDVNGKTFADPDGYRVVLQHAAWPGTNAKATGDVRMSSDADKSDAAFKKLIRMLEEAILAGVTSIGMEFEDRDLIVYYQSGIMGLGAARIPKELERNVLNELVRRAGLDRKTKGKMPVTLVGKQYDVVVEESQSFDEPVFNLTIKERKKKPAK